MHVDPIRTVPASSSCSYRVMAHLTRRVRIAYWKRGIIMKRFLALLVVCVVFTAFSGLALSSNSANQTVTFEIQAINEISVSGSPAKLTISTATAGGNPDNVTDSSTTYSITTNETGKKITGKIDTNMPSNTQLEVNLTAPTVGTSSGNVALSTTAADLVIGISKVADSDLQITYILSATVAAGVVNETSRNVTLTLTDAG